MGMKWTPALMHTLKVGGFKLRLMPAETNPKATENDASISVLIQHKGGRVLLTGDLERDGEKRLLEHNLGRIDVFQAGHHGSKTSNHMELLSMIRPRDVIFSVGHENRFGLPHKDVVRRVRRMGARIWRTDRDGRVWLNFSGRPSIQATHQARLALKQNDPL